MKTFYSQKNYALRLYDPVFNNAAPIQNKLWKMVLSSSLLLLSGCCGGSCGW